MVIRAGDQSLGRRYRALALEKLRSDSQCVGMFVLSMVPQRTGRQLHDCRTQGTRQRSVCPRSQKLSRGSTGVVSNEVLTAPSSVIEVAVGMVSDSSAPVSNRSRSATCHEFVVGSPSPPELLNSGKSLRFVATQVPLRFVSQFRLHPVL